jgi:hypothetical protein
MFHSYLEAFLATIVFLWYMMFMPYTLWGISLLSFPIFDKDAELDFLV